MTRDFLFIAQTEPETIIMIYCYSLVFLKFEFIKLSLKIGQKEVFPNIP